jgi:hypothetical protein
MLRISWVAERLVGSEEGLSSMELVTVLERRVVWYIEIMGVPSTQLQYIMAYYVFIYLLLHVSHIEAILKQLIHSLLLATNVHIDFN